MTRLPFITVIMPIRNEAAFVTRSLSAVLTQDYPSEKTEIIIADGMSTDDTRFIVQQFILQHSSILLLDNPSKIVPAGMNIALRKAKGNIIIRVDGHTIINKDYVRNCVELIQNYEIENVGGKMTAVSNSYISCAVSLATSSPFGVGGARFHYSDKEEFVDTVYMGAWPRRVFEEIGGFDEELVRDQDDEFNYRLRAHGGKILLSPNIKSKYYSRNTLKKLFKQYFQYGFWKVRVLQKHPRQMSLRQFVPPVFVLALLMSLLFVLLPITSSLTFTVPLLYVLANLSASVITASKRGWKYLPLLPITFAILHLGYGFGFLVGLFKFWNRWGDKKGKVPAF